MRSAGEPKGKKRKNGRTGARPGGKGKLPSKTAKQTVMSDCPNKGRRGDCGLCGGKGGQHKKIPTIY